MTIIELLVVMAVLGVAVVMYTSMLIATTRQRVLHREQTLATNAARTIFEEMRNEPFPLVFAMYNADTEDDPEGPGTAPGNRFHVQGLPALAGAELHGEVVFPTTLVQGPEGLGEELREDVVDADIGMPRDLDGDSKIDGEDHSRDYTLLPVRIRVDWRGRNGPRHMALSSQLSYYRRSGS